MVEYTEKVDEMNKSKKDKNKEKWNEHMLTTLEHEFNLRNGIKIPSCDVKWKEQITKKMKRNDKRLTFYSE